MARMGRWEGQEGRVRWKVEGGREVGAFVGGALVGRRSERSRSAVRPDNTPGQDGRRHDGILLIIDGAGS